MSSRTTRRSYQKGGGQKPAQAKSAQPKMAEPKIDMTNAQLLAAQEVKREARKQRQMAAQAAAQRRRSVARIQRIGILAAVLLVLVGGALAFFLNESSKPGQGVPQQPSPHIPNVTDPHAAYDSDPPTSGPHVPQTAPWGVSATPVPKENMVHNLEDGGVVISYRQTSIRLL